MPLFIDHGSGVITSGVIDGLNIATSINYNTSASVQLPGSINLGSGATVGGTGTNFLALGSTPTGGGAGVIASNGPITMNGWGFELRLDGDASHLGTVNLSQGFLAVTPNGTGFESNVVSGSGTQFTINTNSSYTYSGQMFGGGQFVENGSGTVVLTGSNSYSGATVVAQGTLQIGADNVLPSSTTLSIHSGATLDVAGNQTVGQFSGVNYFGFITLETGQTLSVNATSGSTSTSYAGVISGNGALLINGVSGSKFSITGNSNTYGGGTTINGGQLGVHNTTGSALGSGAVTVNSGGRLEGSGSFTGALTLNSGAAVIADPKLSVGATTINGGANYYFLLANATGTSGTDLGLLSISGALTLSATSGNQITITPVTFNGSSPGAAANFNPFSNYTWNLTTGATSLVGTFAANDFTVQTGSFQNTFGNGVFSVGQSGDGINLVLNYTAATAIPEPSTSAAIFGVGVLGFVVHRRRRLRQL